METIEKKKDHPVALLSPDLAPMSCNPVKAHHTDQSIMFDMLWAPGTSTKLEQQIGDGKLNISVSVGKKRPRTEKKNLVMCRDNASTSAYDNSAI